MAGGGLLLSFSWLNPLATEKVKPLPLLKLKHIK
jgi:hypothetical protein